MRKWIYFVLMLVCVIGLCGCRTKPEPRLIHKTYIGEISEIADNTIKIIYYGGANREVEFEITEQTLNVPFNLIIGDIVTIESEYMTDSDEPYPVIMITKEDNQ